MRENTCCFTGHRKLPENEIPKIKKRLLEEIENFIQQDVNCFLAGGALGFDTLAAQSVLKLKEKYPHVHLQLILPCLNQTRHWSAIDVAYYNQIYAKADSIHLTSKYYYKGCMHRRNRYLLDNSRFCICYMDQSDGGTAYTVKYAKQKGLDIINLHCQQLSLFNILP